MFNSSIITAIIAVLSASLSFAGGMGPLKPPCAAEEFKTGPYVGASVGPRLNLTGAPLIYLGAEGNLSAGWGHLWNQRYYLAAEIYGANSVYIKNSGTFREGAAIDTIRSTWSYGIDLIPGFMVSDKTMVYLRGGVAETRVAVKSQFGTIGLNSDGWRVGLGTQTNVYKNLDARMEYIVSVYKTPAQITHEGRPYSNQFNVGIVYKFA